MDRKPKPSFASQAALASLVSPFMGLIIGLATYQPGLMNAWVRLILIQGLNLAGLFFGIYALRNKAQFDRPESKKYATIGMIVCAILVALALLSPLLGMLVHWVIFDAPDEWFFRGWV